MPCLLQWRGSSVNVRQSARATHPGIHMPSGRRAHRGLHIYHGESVARAMLPARLIIVSRHAATPRKIAWSCHPPPPTSSHAAKASVSTNHKIQGSVCHSVRRKQNRISVHIRSPMEASIRFCWTKKSATAPTTDGGGSMETWDLNGLETCGW